MRVAYITAGAAGMYCGSCIHDNTLASALIRDGHEVALIPTYTPVRTDETDVSIDRVFYGAINIYLEQKVPLLKRVPRWADSWLSSPRLLNWVSRLASSTDARELGALTLSMLDGEHGKQRAELDKLLQWLAEDYRPQIVQLTNSMFLGMVHRLREKLGVPVLCAVQGEDLFLDELVEPYRARVLDAMRRRAREVDGFVATSRYYADYMQSLLEIPSERMHHVPLGLKLDGHAEQSGPATDDPFVVGYMARQCPEKGLHALVEAFRMLAERVGRERVRLKIAGYVSPKDRQYHDGIRESVRSCGLESAVEFLGEVDRQGKLDLLGSIHVLSVPTVYREPKGLFVLEALANGVPVVQPDHGSFPELIDETGGGILVEPHSAEALADGLHRLMQEPERRRQLGAQGKRVVHERYNDHVMARRTAELFEGFIGATADVPASTGGTES